MKLKALKSFSGAYCGNITAGDQFTCDNDDFTHHLIQNKLVEPVGKFAYQNKIHKEDNKKKHPMDSVKPTPPDTDPPAPKESKDSIGLEGGAGKPSFASPADQALPTDKSNISEKEESKEGAASSSPTPPIGPSTSPTSSMDAMDSGGDTTQKEAKSPRGKTSKKQQKKRKGGRKTKERQKPTA